MSIWLQIAAVAAGLLAVGWIVTSFLAPGRTRVAVEWLSALAMYAALIALMAHAFARTESRGGAIFFGFLIAMFGAGFLVALRLFVRDLSGRGAGAGPGATH
ncbi:MAG TPA: hypothetical protein VMW35_19890 [Myxococcota bacterium]|jgi:hypothetical protein|nr:hypothetical protein [Myxococcota bacterium]